jgi:hypothetical protein
VRRGVVLGPESWLRFAIGAGVLGIALVLLTRSDLLRQGPIVPAPERLTQQLVADIHGALAITGLTSATEHTRLALRKDAAAPEDILYAWEDKTLNVTRAHGRLGAPKVDEVLAEGVTALKLTPYGLVRDPNAPSGRYLRRGVPLAEVCLFVLELETKAKFHLVTKIWIDERLLAFRYPEFFATPDDTPGRI